MDINVYVGMTWKWKFAAWFAVVGLISLTPIAIGIKNGWPWYGIMVFPAVLGLASFADIINHSSKQPPEREQE